MENELIKKIACKNNKALEQLYDSYERVTYTVAFRILKEADLAEKVIKQLFQTIWENGGTILYPDKKLSIQLVAITRQMALHCLKANKNEGAEKEYNE